MGVMATIRKFQFDLDFDAVACAAATPPHEVEETAPPTFTEQDLAEAKARALAQGREAGLAEAAKSCERQAAAALAAIAKTLEQTASAHRQAIEARHDAALTLAVAVARKLVPALLRDNAATAVESAVADILPRVIDEPRLVIRVDGGMIDSLKEPLDALAARTGFAGKIILLGDERIRAADCRIEWADGGAEHDFDRLAREIEATVDRFLHGVGNETPTVPDETVNRDTQETFNG